MLIVLIIIFVIIYALLKRIDIYDEFLKGALESFDMFKKIFPCLLAMIFSVNVFLKSGLIEFIYRIFRPIFNIITIPVEILPMIIMRPISGTSTLALLNEIFSKHGPDSLIGTLGSIIQGSTDTTFYVITLYFGSIGIKKIRYALKAGLFADLIGIISSIIIVKILFH